MNIGKMANQLLNGCKKFYQQQAPAQKISDPALPRDFSCTLLATPPLINHVGWVRRHETQHLFVQPHKMLGFAVAQPNLRCFKLPANI